MAAHEEPTLGSMWTNCTIRMPEGDHKVFDSERADYERALCVYFNSTIGILSMLGSFKRMGMLFRLESTATDLKGLPVPDFSLLPRRAEVYGRGIRRDWRV